MSRVVNFVCLANSLKYRGRCLAGIDLSSGEWIRPVAQTTHGELHREHYMLDMGGEPRVLDVIRIGLDGPQALRHQPENWLVSAKPWHVVAQKLSEERLLSHITAGPDLFGDRGHRIPVSAFEQQSAPASLALVEPEGLQWF